jgi:hypothetical protein
VSAVAGLAGCSGSGATTFEADAAATATGDTGYEREDERTPTITREFAGQEVKVTNVITEYQKTMSIPLLGEAKLGVFTAFTSPQVKVAGQSFNPIGQWSTKKLVTELQSRYDSMNDVQKEGEESQKVLGSTRTVSTFSATMTVDGNDVPIILLVAKFKHESDIVVPMGIFPEERRDKEGTNIRTLMSNMSHPA